MGRTALLLFLSFAAASALAETPAAPRSVFLEELTWTEVRDATQAGKTTIILPVGGTEQNGPHMVLGKHNARVKFLSGKIAAALGNALVAPVLAYAPEGKETPPTAHMRFPGTITIPDATFEEILLSAARGFRLHAFKDVVFIGDHGGYQKSLRKVAASLNAEWAKTPVRAHAIEQYYAALDGGFSEMLTQKGFAPAQIGTHAGLADTSLALAVAPSLVRMDKLGAATRGKADGVYGDPRRATAELGQPGLEMVVARTVDAIKASIARRQ
jgi:creatinine amidohydrolase